MPTGATAGCSPPARSTAPRSSAARCSPITSRRAASVELGCWASSAVQGLGVARAASEALIAYARAELAAERVAWRSTTVNRRSRGLAERLGFRYEGTLRSAYVLRGERYDLDVLSLVGAELDDMGG